MPVSLEIKAYQPERSLYHVPWISGCNVARAGSQSLGASGPGKLERKRGWNWSSYVVFGPSQNSQCYLLTAATSNSSRGIIVVVALDSP